MWFSTRNKGFSPRSSLEPALLSPSWWSPRLAQGLWCDDLVSAPWWEPWTPCLTLVRLEGQWGPLSPLTPLLLSRQWPAYFSVSTELELQSWQLHLCGWIWKQFIRCHSSSKWSVEAPCRAWVPAAPRCSAPTCSLPFIVCSGLCSAVLHVWLPWWLGGLFRRQDWVRCLLFY